VLRNTVESTGWQTVGSENIASDATDFSSVALQGQVVESPIRMRDLDRVAQGGTIMLKQWTAMAGRPVSYSDRFVVEHVLPVMDFMARTYQLMIQMEAPIRLRHSWIKASPRPVRLLISFKLGLWQGDMGSG